MRRDLTVHIFSHEEQRRSPDDPQLHRSTAYLVPEMSSHIPVQRLGNQLPCFHFPGQLALVSTESDAAQMPGKRRWRSEVARTKRENSELWFSALLSWQRRTKKLIAALSSVILKKQPPTRKWTMNSLPFSSSIRKFIRRWKRFSLILVSVNFLSFHITLLSDALVKNKKVDVVTSINMPFDMFLAKCNSVAPYRIRTGRNLTDNEDQVDLIIRMAQLLCPEDRSSRWHRRLEIWEHQLTISAST